MNFKNVQQFLSIASLELWVWSIPALVFVFFFNTFFKWTIIGIQTSQVAQW